MKRKSTILVAAATVAALLAAGPAIAQESQPPIPQESWSFAGPFGTFDRNQLRRGFQVFKEVCSGCHSADLLSFRNLSEPGGPEFSEEQVKALAATYTINDPTAKDGKRPATPADRWPNPFPSEQAARDSFGGALPPDMSVLAKARGIHQDFPFWIFNYFTTYQEGGPDYIHAIVTGYKDAPADFKLPPGKFYNEYFPGHAISMPPPLSDGQVKYAGEGAAVPQTVEQYSKDVAAFLEWMSDPQMVPRKEAGFRVILFLVLLAVLMWLVKRRVWSNVHWRPAAPEMTKQAESR